MKEGRVPGELLLINHPPCTWCHVEYFLRTQGKDITVVTRGVYQPVFNALGTATIGIADSSLTRVKAGSYMHLRRMALGVLVKCFESDDNYPEYKGFEVIDQTVERLENRRRVMLSPSGGIDASNWRKGVGEVAKKLLDNKTSGLVKLTMVKFDARRFLHPHQVTLGSFESCISGVKDFSPVSFTEYLHQKYRENFD